jgi:hypothetical protein
MGKTRRERLKAYLHDEAGASIEEINDELKALYAREKLLEAVVDEYEGLMGELPGDFDTPALDSLHIADGKCRFAVDMRDMYKGSGICIDCCHDLKENPR